MQYKKSSQLKYFVSIGAGLNQIPLIDEAKKLGFNVIGVDASVSAQGFIKCDLKIQESIENHEAIYTKLRELLVDGEITCNMTKSFGSAIRTTSYINEKFKIPYLPFEKSEYFINKRLMKKALIENSIETPPLLGISAKTSPDRLPDSMFPMIIKPVSGHAKINVMLINNLNDFKRAISKLISFDENIFERYIEGDEIIAIGIIHNRRYHLIDISDKVLSRPPFFIDMMHTTPSKYADLSEKISSIGQKVTHAFGIVNSPLIMEFRIDSDKKPMLIEAVPEFGGEFLSDIMLPIRGYNIISESIKSMTGGDFKAPIQPTKQCVAVRYIESSSGTLSSFNPEGPLSVPGIVYSRIFKEIGSETRKPMTNLDRIGVVVAKGKTRDEAVSSAKEAVEKFNIRIN
jgi:biotin carboxylase